MRKINSISLAVISMCAATLAFSSCQKDEIKGGADSRYVTLAVTAEEGVETKSAGVERFETVEVSEGDLSLYVDASVAVNTMNPFADVATKGVMVNAADDINEFNVLMTGADGTNRSGVAKQSDMSHWAIYDGSAKVEWPNHDGSVKYDFLAYYLQGDNSSFNTGSLLYTGPASTVSAASMNDFLVAKTVGRTHTEKTYHTGDDNVPIHFYHPLAAVRFNVNGATVTKVTINNLKKDGTVEVKNVEYKDNESFKSAIEWSDLSGKVSYSQSFTEAANSEMFFIVPQDLADVTLTFDIVKDGATHQFSTKAKNLGTVSWDAGYVYNYTVDTNPAGNVGITVVEDTFNATSNIKEHVRVHNDMRSTTFIRAYVLANWCNAKGFIVSNYDGEIGYNEADWTKSGKFYYSNSPVVGFTDSKDLVSRFTFNRNEKPADNLHLEVKIIAQAVEWDSSVSEAKNAAWTKSQE